MRGVVVEEGLDHLSGGHLALNRVEEANELRMSMALHASADYRPSSTAASPLRPPASAARKEPLKAKCVARHGRRMDGPQPHAPRR